ncbi:HK97 family phage prohead protease [Paracoccus sp. SCSIO 75233]|uniref:HK97 family phage prohead protease n=1 Tax=Paracoccus sp. SCSIO 75233 TaxID=3017782 RepID=UPI0022F06687|nr:HK97 family phage prohead protease [Paracoccus sp. SCSIO 75233]WBU53335.1 HK97 family phage prohead protease [Paracoccus sp. SCSIO 75233]
MDAATYEGGLELRASGDGSRRLRGKFPYRSRAVMHSGGKGQRPRKEEFAPGAFSFAVDDPEREIHLLVGHSFDRPLASKKAGTLIFNDTPEALLFEAELTLEIQRTSWVQDFLAAFAAGLITGLSPGFRVAPIEGAEETTEEDPAEGNALIRLLLAVVLFEFSLVTRPAYDATEADLRNWKPTDGGVLLPENPPVRQALNRWRA